MKNIKVLFFIFLLFFTFHLVYGELNLPFSKKDIPLEDHINKDLISELKQIQKDGKSLDWSEKNKLIVTAKKNFDEYYDLVIFKPDGSKEENLNINKKSAPTKHNGNPCWHPSGEWIIFTAQNEDALGYFNMKKSIPGTGMNCNLCVMDKKGENYWKQTFHETSIRDTKAVIHPQISKDGNKVFWAERIKDSEETNWGEWVLKIADFEVVDGIPKLINKQTIRISEKKCFYESHDFNSEGNKILFSANLKEGVEENGLDIYEYDLETRELKNLTNSPDEWDEHAHYSPDGKRIIWMSSKSIPIKWGSIKGHKWQSYLKTDLWVMDVSGENKTRLTYFNKIPEKESVNRNFRVIVSDCAWSPEGDSVLATVVIINGGKIENKQILFKLKNNGSQDEKK
ncbi:MAG: hypothetical protein PHV06_00765 [bacterium]|nr:hypothetical protein [bacterium]